MLYHKDLGLPDIQLPERPVLLAYSGHARRAAKNDRYGGDLTRWLPHRLTLGCTTVVEAGFNDRTGRLNHLLVRYNLPGTDLDLVLALCPGRKAWTVKTVWANESDDDHITLDPRRYTHPQGVAN